MSDLIERQAAIDAMAELQGRTYTKAELKGISKAWKRIKQLSSAQPEIIRRKDCEYGEQDDVGRWFCNDLGCQIGSDDGSGYCANAERRTDELGDK